MKVDNLVTDSVPTRKVTVHSNSWNRPSPGQRPRLEPRKLRKSFQLNLSIDVFLTLTVLEKPRENPDILEFFNDSNPSSTLTVVLRAKSVRKNVIFFKKIFFFKDKFIFEILVLEQFPSNRELGSPRLGGQSESWLGGQ